MGFDLSSAKPVTAAPPGGGFDLSSAKLEELRRRRVTDAIILAMTDAMGDESGVKQTAPGRTKGK